MNMDFFLSDEITSPPATPPSIADTLMETHLHDNGNIIATSRPMQKQRSSYIEVGSSSMDKSQLDYIGKVKSNFQQFTLQQQLFFLSEILGSCDNQLLQYVYTFITPKLKKDFLKELPIELSLHVLSFIDDPRTLARASRVNRFWNRLLKDEAAWKALCLKHQYNSHFQYYKQSNQVVSYRDFFRRKYNIDTAWNQGGRVTPCENQIGDCLATSVQMDDTFIAVGCDNNRIEVFDATTGKHIRSLLDHEGGVWALQFIKNKNNEHILVTGGCDRMARVWNLGTGERRHVLRGHSSTIRCLKIKDEYTAVSGSRDATLRIWDIENGELRHACIGHQSSVRCLDICGNQVASGSYDTTARLWDMDTGECLQEFIGHHSQIYSIAFDGTKVVTGSLDSNIRVWSAQTGHCLRTLQGHTSLVGHLQLSSTNILVSGGSDGCLRIWDLNSYTCRHRISAHDNSVTCLQFDERRVLSGGSDGQVKLWDIETGALIRSFTQTAKTVWKVHMIETKAVVILQRDPTDNTQRNIPQTVIELHDFDWNNHNN